MKILGIETSCDDTAIGIIENDKILSSIVISQDEIHDKLGGIMPELAGRTHLQKIHECLFLSLKESGCSIEDIGLICVTQGPGLQSSLLVGNYFSMGLSQRNNIPVYGIDHLEAHILVSRIFYDLPFPFLSLLISGGHSMIVLCENPMSFKIIGQTLDDSIGEVFDKIAKCMGFSFPGGRDLDLLSTTGKYINIFPVLLQDNKSCDFSFSGLKTFVKNAIDSNLYKNEDIAFSFITTAWKLINRNLNRAINITGLKNIVVCGGVASNSFFRSKLLLKESEEGLKIYFPLAKYCTDNGVMIAVAGREKIKFSKDNNIDFPQTYNYDGSKFYTNCKMLEF
jgi:N6-L-threonylcarbamoyladenine synthase